MNRKDKIKFLKDVQGGNVNPDDLIDPDVCHLVGYEDYHPYYINQKPVTHARYIVALEMVRRKWELTGENQIKVTYGKAGKPGYPFAVKKADLKQFYDQQKQSLNNHL